jgi:RNA polymerase sigma-70 factor (ECF subfamily)
MTPRSVQRPVVSHVPDPVRAAALASVASEHDLVARIRSGDAAAFEAMFHTYYDTLCAFAIGYVGSREVAEELVHDVLLRIWQLQDRWEVREELRSYLYRSVRNRAINALKRERVARRWEDATIASAPATGIGQSPALADEVARLNELAVAIRHELGQLPERQRQAYLLRWQHELSYAEIAATMGISTKTVESTLARVTKRLRQALHPFF